MGVHHKVPTKGMKRKGSGCCGILPRLLHLFFFFLLSVNEGVNPKLHGA